MTRWPRRRGRRRASRPAAPGSCAGGAPPCRATAPPRRCPTTVPIVSKKSDSMIEKIARTRGEDAQPGEDLEVDPGAERREVRPGHERPPAPPPRRASSTRVPPWSALTRIARMVVPRMPRSSAARTPRARKRSVRSRPATATRTFGLVRAPSVTGMPWPGRTMPPLTRPMKRMKRPMPDRDRALERERDRVQHRLPHADQDEERDHDALEEDHAHGGLPRELLRRDQLEGDHGVEPHPGRDGQGVVRDEPHRGRREGRDQAGGREGRRERDALRLERAGCRRRRGSPGSRR